MIKEQHTDAKKLIKSYLNNMKIIKKNKKKFSSWGVMIWILNRVIWSENPVSLIESKKQDCFFSLNSQFMI